MKFITTKNMSPLSVLIRWGTGEDSSHFAWVYDGKWAFHSNLLGCHPQWFSTFKKKATIVHEVDYDCAVEEEEQTWQATMEKFDDRGYDFGALFYFSWRVFLLKFFKIPIPTKNKWGSKDKFLCTEVFDTLPIKIQNKIRELYGLLDAGIISPTKLIGMVKHAVEEIMKERVANG